MTYTYFNDLYFFTATILNRQMLLSDDRMKQIIISSLIHMSQERVHIHGFVVMPNHIHVLLRLNHDTPVCFQRDFLKYTAQRFLQLLKYEASAILPDYASTQADRKYQVWERRPCWIRLGHQDVLEVKLAYMHHNPVAGKWKLTTDPALYKWSSCAFYAGLEQPYDFLINVHKDS